MLYLVAIICPPLACLIAGKPGQAVLNFFLWAFCLWVPGVIHGCFVVSQAANEQRDRLREWNAEQRHRQTIEAMTASRDRPRRRRQRDDD